MTDFRKGADKIRFRRGNERDLHLLDLAEPAFITDTKRIVVGTGTENIELAQRKHVQLGVGIVPSMIYRDDGMDDRAFLQRAIDYCEAHNLKLVLEYGRVYILSGSLLYRSLELDGNSATLRMRTMNAPILVSRHVVNTQEAIGGNSSITNLKFEGNLANNQNHGIQAVSYTSRYDNLEFSDIGGTALLITNAVNNVNVVSSTYEGDVIQNIRINGAGIHGIFIGDTANNGRLTFGTIRNVFIRTRGTTGINIPSCVGWTISGVRINSYEGTFPATGIYISNGSRSSLSDIQIMGYRTNALVLAGLYPNLTLSNVIIDSSRGAAGHSVIQLNRATWAYDEDDVHVSFTNLNVTHETANRANLFTLTAPLYVTVSSLGIAGSGEGLLTVAHTTSSEVSDPNKYIQYLLNASVSGRLEDTPEKNRIQYEGRQLKQVAHAHFNTVGGIFQNFPMPVVPAGGIILCDVTIRSLNAGNSSAYTEPARWHGQIMVVRRASSVEASGGIAYTLHDVSEPEGFTSYPQARPTSGNVFQVSFTIGGTVPVVGIITVEYTVCPPA